VTGPADLDAQRVAAAIETAAAWVVGQIDGGAEPAQVAVVVPVVDVYGPVLADRLRRLRGGSGRVPVGVEIAGGLPLSATPGGRRVLGLLRAVASGLALDDTVRVLPWLRRAAQARDDRRDRLSPSRARDLAYGIGMSGVPVVAGTPLDWAGRLRGRRDRLQRGLEAAERAPLAERRRRALEHQTARRWLKDVEPILSGVEALQALAATVTAADSVAVVGDAVAAFARRWLRMPAAPADVLERVSALAAALAPPVEGAGAAAAQTLAAAVQRARHSLPPGDAAAIFVGTAADVAARGFTAVWHCETASAGARAIPPAAGKPSRRTARAALTAAARRPDETGDRPLRPAEIEAGVVSSDRIQTMLAATRADAHGTSSGVIAADAWATVVPPGLTPQRPLSATGVAALLACPYRFLLERILFLREPPRSPPLDSVAPIVYGQLFHTAAERLFGVAGPALCARQGALDEWTTVAAGCLDAVLDEHFFEQPLRVPGAAETVRRRLHDQLAELVRYEWTLPPRSFVASEMTFGDPDPVALDAAGTTVYLRGAVDRVDRLAAGGLALRDLKTGRLWPLEAEPANPGRDLQLGMYVLALEASIGERVVTAAYVSPAAPHAVERTFAEGHLEALRERTRQWLGVASALLRAGAFPRTVNASECAVCAFRPLCGDGAWARSAEQLSRLPADAPAAGFARLPRRDPAAPVEAAARRARVRGPGWMLRRFLLGLRALADRDDGVAEAALIGPPFFAVALSDLVTERAARGVAVPPERAVRMDAVRAVVDALRLSRHDGFPGAVACDLIEESGLGRTVAAGDEAAETLALLYAAAAQLEWLASADGLDFDAVTEPVRTWLAAPDWTATG